MVRRDAEGHGGCDDADKVAVVGQIDKKRAEKYGQTDGKFDQVPFEHGRHRHGYLLIIIEWIVSRLGRRHIVFIRCTFILAYFLDKIYKKSKNDDLFGAFSRVLNGGKVRYLKKFNHADGFWRGKP